MPDYIKLPRLKAKVEKNASLFHLVPHNEKGQSSLTCELSENSGLNGYRPRSLLRSFRAPQRADPPRSFLEHQADICPFARPSHGLRRLTGTSVIYVLFTLYTTVKADFRVKTRGRGKVSVRVGSVGSTPCHSVQDL